MIAQVVIQAVTALSASICYNISRSKRELHLEKPQAASHSTHIELKLVQAHPPILGTRQHRSICAESCASPQAADAICVNCLDYFLDIFVFLKANFYEFPERGWCTNGMGHDWTDMGQWTMRHQLLGKAEVVQHCSHLGTRVHPCQHGRTGNADHWSCLRTRWAKLPASDMGYLHYMKLSGYQMNDTKCQSASTHRFPR